MCGRGTEVVGFGDIEEGPLRDCGSSWDSLGEPISCSRERHQGCVGEHTYTPTYSVGQFFAQTDHLGYKLVSTQHEGLEGKNARGVPLALTRPTRSHERVQDSVARAFVRLKQASRPWGSVVIDKTRDVGQRKDSRCCSTQCQSHELWEQQLTHLQA